MSIYNSNDPRSREVQTSEDMRRQAAEEIDQETEFFFRRVMQSIAEPSPEFEVFARNLTREMLTIVRGVKYRTEQIGENTMRAAAIAHQAWDATQVTISVVANQGMAAYEDICSTAEVTGMNAAAHGWSDMDDVNRTFEGATRELVRQAREAQAAGRPHTPETQANKVLSYLVKEHGSDLADLPGVKDAIAKLQVVPNLEDL